MEQTANYHQPVLLHESVEMLCINPGGTYVDATMGGGGHSKAILKQLTSGKLFAFDQDSDSWENAPICDQFVLIKENFKHAKQWLKYHGVSKIDGLLADIGVSSHQFDQGNRGFSIRTDGPLDMRMNTNQQLSAYTVVNEYTEDQLTRIFNEFGEVEKSHLVSKKILASRPILSTHHLMRVLVDGEIDIAKHHAFYAKVFQSIRIEVNQELDALKNLLDQSVELVKPGGRLVVISYHSLEDRIVKSFLRSGNFRDVQEKDFYGKILRPFSPKQSKPIVPSFTEIAANSRARSAKMRVGIRI
jgi:16S rRNA (cytosine1402-N4)-methyltransferase